MKRNKHRESRPVPRASRLCAICQERYVRPRDKVCSSCAHTFDLSEPWAKEAIKLTDKEYEQELQRELHEVPLESVDEQENVRS